MIASCRFNNLIKKDKNPTSKEVEDYALETSRNRLYIVLLCICFAFVILVFRIFDISLSSTEDIKNYASKKDNIDFFLQRASIVDRNGIILATNLSTASLYANPQKIIDKDITITKICEALSYLDCDELKVKLKSDKTFAWIRRHLTPREQQVIHDLGLPGLYFIKEEKRVYPQSNLFSHILGYVDVDGNGIAGVENYFNKELLKEGEDHIQLAVDTRIQQVLHEEISNQIHEHDAIGGSGIIMDVKTGEILSMVSLPDYDPHHVNNSIDRQRFNQVTLGVYEMGSTFKILTLAMGLNGKYIGVNNTFNSGAVIKVGRKQISDYKGRGDILSIPEILMYSSNIGTAQIAMKVGIDEQRSYLKRFGLMEAIKLELPEKGYPLYPSQKLWSNASLVTISYGHGMAVTQLHAARAFSAVINGGYLPEPTLIKRDNFKFPMQEKQIISSKTSDIMRRIMRLTVTHGSGKRANVSGYLVGGKTGTSEKVIGKVYSKRANLSSFIGAFPIHDPQYVIIVMIDEPSPNKANGGILTGGITVAPAVGRIIERIAPILKISPVDESDPEIRAKLAIEFTPRRKPLD